MACLDRSDVCADKLSMNRQIFSSPFAAAESAAETLRGQIGELNGQHVKLAKAEGEFVWHHHAEADELFLVVQGALDMHLRDPDGSERIVTLAQGELLVVPQGVEHKPVAREGGAQLLLFEPAGTRNTGNIIGEHTVEAEDLKRLDGGGR